MSSPSRHATPSEQANKPTSPNHLHHRERVAPVKPIVRRTSSSASEMDAAASGNHASTSRSAADDDEGGKRHSIPAVKALPYRPREARRNLVAFWMLGLLNNSSYVVMLASAKHIEAGGVGLVYLAAVLPGLLLKLSAAFWFHRAPYAVRALMVAFAMLGAFTLVAEASKRGSLTVGTVLCCRHGLQHSTATGAHSQHTLEDSKVSPRRARLTPTRRGGGLLLLVEASRGSCWGWRCARCKADWASPPSWRSAAATPTLAPASPPGPAGRDSPASSGTLWAMIVERRTGRRAAVGRQRLGRL
jgi:hypothetical protein